jgi:hypothetical protein
MCSLVTLPRSPDGAHRSGNPLTPRTIPESTISALRELLVRMVRDEPQANAEGLARAGDEVRRALRDLCDNARENRVRVEQLVIAIKQGWSSLHSDHPRTRSAGPDELLNQVITLCIDEYYSERELR